MKGLKLWHGLLAGAVVLVVILVVALRGQGKKETAKIVFTLGDVHVAHAEVRIGEREIRGQARLSDGDTVSTGPDGRARVRLDDGTLVVIDADTSFSLNGARLALEKGRLFVQGGAASRTEVSLGNASTTVSSSAVAFERRKENKIYCAQGELVVNVAGKQARVASGETATLGADAKVAPEKAFDDWTGGLAVPWAGQSGAKSAIAELRGSGAGAEPEAPLVVRSQHIDVLIEGELARTRTSATYFNGSERSVTADVRLAIPENAILSRVARRQGSGAASEASLVIAKPGTATNSAARLEWAGGGWLRGELPNIEPGGSIELELEWVEWLSTRGDRAAYRFPIASEGEPPLIGELTARVDASLSGTPWLTASAGASVNDRLVEFRKADVHPTGDLVVELAPTVVRAGAARAYVVQGERGEDPYVMIRTEVPERSEPGVSLAVVLDTSMSIGASALETQRAVVDALLEGLGPRDSLAVLAADQTTRPVGPATPQPVNDKLRAEVRKALGALRPGGASNLGLALQDAADLLDAPGRGKSAGSGMVVYIGDGRPTVGEPDAEGLRRRLSRRASGTPRLGAVVVGSGADRWMLGRLTTGAGKVYEVADRSDAAQAGAALLADALEPTLRDVELDLGPTIDRIYPREARAALAGGTVTVVGRLRGELPRHVDFRFRDGSKPVSEKRPLQRMALPQHADVPQRWAAARIEEMAARGDGLEPAIALAHQARLLTPWTSWFFDISSSSSDSSLPFASRVLELSPELDAPFAPYVERVAPSASTLLEPPREFGGGVSLETAAQVAIRRILEQARGAIRACREARAAVRPEVTREFDIRVSVDADGRASDVRVSLFGVREGDPVLERCVKGVVAALPYFAAGVRIDVQHKIVVPEGRSSRRTKCSLTSKLALPVRRGVWRARGTVGVDAYVAAAKACELPGWPDRRELLLLLLERSTSAEAKLQLASALEAIGESDAAAFVRKETLRRVSTFAELEALSRVIMSDEPAIDGELEKAYVKAVSNEDRLQVVRRFLLLAPHNALARRRLLALLEALGRNDALVQEIERLRADPFADAGLLAQGASALKRAGHDSESRRAFGELVERAPRDPWTLAYVGDRLRAEGMFDEAVAAYESLARIMPDDAAVALRLALAHAGAKRLDVATRLLERVTQTGGRGDDGRVGELASITQAVLLAGARAGAETEDIRSQLVRRLMQTPLPDVSALVLVQAPPADDPIEVKVTREKGEREQQPPDFDARSLGITALRIERGDGEARILLSRPSDAGPSKPARATVAALVLADDRGASRLVTREVEVQSDGKAVELRWNGEAFL
jgi:Mg-chelatase subunit ChlD/tetratricopeptide (TPR) repeat protein